MLITLIINPTTGKEFTIEIDNETTIGELKKILAKKLKVGREVISLLYMNGLLTTGTLASHELTTGSTLRLVPCIETGILTPRPEQSVLEALESLNENQVSDFLTGKSPLNLTMRLGEHVMLIQLQLSKGIPSPSSASSHAHQLSPSSVTATSSSSSLHKQGYNGGVELSSEAGPSKPNLTEASRSLTNTLKKLSTTVSKEDDLSRHMHHHGKGIYSGTFSGTLNPILQDTAGKPKKHVSTIVHILNDLLGGVDLKSSNSVGTSQATSTGSTTTSTFGDPGNVAGSSSTCSVGGKRKSTELPSPAHPEKISKSEQLAAEENLILKSKVDRLINELKLKRKERLQRHNIMS